MDKLRNKFQQIVDHTTNLSLQRAVSADLFHSLTRVEQRSNYLQGDLDIQDKLRTIKELEVWGKDCIRLVEEAKTELANIKTESYNQLAVVDRRLSSLKSWMIAFNNILEGNRLILDECVKNKYHNDSTTKDFCLQVFQQIWISNEDIGAIVEEIAKILLEDDYR